MEGVVVEGVMKGEGGRSVGERVECAEALVHESLYSAPRVPPWRFHTFRRSDIDDDV